jgi:hypothetical protein
MILPLIAAFLGEHGYAFIVAVIVYLAWPAVLVWLLVWLLVLLPIRAMRRRNHEPWRRSQSA